MSLQAKAEAAAAQKAAAAAVAKQRAVEAQLQV